MIFVVLKEILGWDGEVNRRVERIVIGFRKMGFVLLREILGGWDGEVNRRVDRIVLGFKRMGFVVQVRRFGGMKITYIIFVWKSGSSG